MPAEVIEKLMTNKRLYNIILHNFPDLLTRRHSEENINIEPSVAVKEPTKMNLTLMAKKPKNEEPKKNSNTQENGDKKNMKEKVKEDKKDALKESAKKETTIEVAKNTPASNSNAEVKTTKTSNPLSKDSSKLVATQPQQPNWLSRQISTDHHYLRDMPLYKNTIMYRGAMMNIPRYKLRASSLPDIYRNSTWSIWSGSDNEKVSASKRKSPSINQNNLYLT